MSDAAIANIVTGVVTVVTLITGVIALWIRQRATEDKVAVVEKKIDTNTVITQAGTQAAATAAVAAKDAATEAATQATTANAEKTAILQDISHRINGGLESTIRAMIDPVRQLLTDHAAADDRNMEEIKATLAELKRKVQMR